MFKLNYRNGQPIYEQIKGQFHKLIVSGGMKPDEKLPSIREISSNLAINPNTIQRAYRELEAEGYIYTIPGKGSFVSSSMEVNTEKITSLLQEFDSIVNELFYLNYPATQLISKIESKNKE